MESYDVKPANENGEGLPAGSWKPIGDGFSLGMVGVGQHFPHFCFSWFSG